MSFIQKPTKPLDELIVQEVLNRRAQGLIAPGRQDVVRRQFLFLGRGMIMKGKRRWV